MGEFDGKVILVTGGGTGLGAAIAVGAAKRGAKALILNYSKSRKEAEATAKAVEAAGAEAKLVQGDVSDDADCRKIAAAAAPYGKLDALVNNAGTTKHVPKHADLDGLSKEDFLRIFATNTVAPFQMLRACRCLLEASGLGSVLMTSSIAGVTGGGSSVAYAASKGALNTMTLSLARALAQKSASTPSVRASSTRAGSAMLTTRKLPNACARTCALQLHCVWSPRPRILPMRRCS
jgi:3-oxoacyl-[acyl-carrier protein] reductase